MIESSITVFGNTPMHFAQAVSFLWFSPDPQEQHLIRILLQLPAFFEPVQLWTIMFAMVFLAAELRQRDEGNLKGPGDFLQLPRNPRDFLNAVFERADGVQRLQVIDDAKIDRQAPRSVRPKQVRDALNRGIALVDDQELISSSCSCMVSLAILLRSNGESVPSRNRYAFTSARPAIERW